MLEKIRYFIPQKKKIHQNLCGFQLNDLLPSQKYIIIKCRKYLLSMYNIRNIFIIILPNYCRIDNSSYE